LAREAAQTLAAGEPRLDRSDQIARITEGIGEGPNAIQPAAEKISADAYLASPYVTDTMGETR
jgi:hypothetical protein